MTEIKDDGKSKKTWCMTWHNYTEENIQKIKDLEGINLLTIGKEVGEAGETPHLQVSMTFKKACRWAQLAKIFKSIHITPAISPDWSHNYCIKEDKYIRIDNRKQGARNDLKEIATTIATKGLSTAITERPDVYIKYPRGMEKLDAFYNEKKRDFKPTVYWLYGPSGTGKTRYVYEHETDLWISGSNLKWWDGYKGQEAVLIDDFRETDCDFKTMIRLLDRYPFRVENKGGTREIYSKRMYITTPYSPKRTFNTTEELYQLTRRCDYIIKYTHNGVIYKQTPENPAKPPVTDVTDVTEVGEGNTSLSKTSKIIYNRKTLCFD
ncbi:Rep [uncultured virus]|uniref:ATP-dependent helicase Rep n=1 Tax=uncultured virus TaxID=340016 RepID=A0A2K9LT15_9VIRU|nr:Rep [uncultured virus]